MSYEELGLSKEDQLEIRRKAVQGAIKDELLPIYPLVDRLQSDKVAAENTATIVKIAETEGVSIEEATIIYSERVLLDRKDIEKEMQDGEDI